MTRREASLPSLRTDRVLLAEGQDDKHAVTHFYRSRFEAEPPFDIKDMEGYTRLRAAIGPKLKAPDRQVVGIIVDANSDSRSRWRAVMDRLRQACPDIEVGDPAPSGLIVNGVPRAGVGLWPDNESGGEIEDFIATMIPCDDRVWPLARRYIENIPEEHRQFSEGKTARAEIHAWLAARREPRRMGAAIGTGDLKVYGGLADRFSSWLDNLFQGPA